MHIKLHTWAWCLCWLFLHGLPPSLAKKRVFGNRQAMAASEAARKEASVDAELLSLHEAEHDEAMGRSHLVTELPGLPFGYEAAMYAGHGSVHEPTLKNKGTLFYWLVESQHKADSAPLLIWINGGPGCSSLEGLLIEHGPFLAVDTGFDLELNAYAWNRKANVLYIDQPVGTGYATAQDDKYAKSQEEVNTMFVAFLRRFFDMHPRYRHREMFLAGESYAGRYIPHFAKEILAADSAIGFNLQGVMIGNGWTHPIVQSQSFPDFSFSTGLISEQQKRDYDGLAAECVKNYRDDPYSHHTWVVCERLQTSVPNLSGNDKIGKINMYDVRLYDTTAGGDWPWRTTGEKSYLQREDVRRALHVKHKVTWDECSDEVEQALTHEDMYPTVEEFTGMLHARLRVLVYNGQFDWICNHLGVERMLDQLDFEGKSDFVSPQQRAGWVSGSRLAGYVKHGGNLSFLLVLGGSHMVPMDKRPQTYDMLERFLNNKPFADIKTQGLEAQLAADPRRDVKSSEEHPTKKSGGVSQATQLGQPQQDVYDDGKPQMRLVDAAPYVPGSTANYGSVLLVSMGVVIGLSLYPAAAFLARWMSSRARAASCIPHDSRTPMLA
eukprot:TRINITY_DN53827_c0_g1_i1.p1 TRINITY_DN53827_c0_g1~~TRINITY_DN53827_c0_g1_i1.p1  ORF type:complete len:607 (+),score=139.96 TRINITY_DN53827_c0_g1_i1:248-2068(+)